MQCNHASIFIDESRLVLATFAMFAQLSAIYGLRFPTREMRPDKTVTRAFNSNLSQV